MLDVIPVELGYPSGDVRDELFAAVDVEEPVEEVRLNDTNDLRVRELSAEAELLRADPALCAHVEPEGGVSDDLCSENEQGVIDEEGLVVFERGPESGAKELGP